MLTNKLYSVYSHTAPNGKKYIGITCKVPISKRWGKNGYYYRTQCKFYAAIKKYGWDNFKHEVLYTGLSLDSAYEKEKQLIRECDSVNNGYNSDYGGAGAEGHTTTEEARRKMSERAKNRPSPMLGVSLPKHKVYLYDLTGNLILTTNGYAEMAKQLDCARSTLVNFCNYGRVYKGTYIIMNESNIDLLQDRLQLAAKKNKLAKEPKIFQFDLQGNLLDSFVLYREASEKTGIAIGSIGKVCSGVDLITHGFIFLHTNDKDVLNKRVELINNKNKKYKYNIPYKSKIKEDDK